MKNSTGVLPPLQSSKLLDQVRERIRYMHYSIRTEQAYVHWVRAFIRFHGLRHPAEMGGAEVPALREQMAKARVVWAADREAGRGGLYMPNALDRKYPRAGVSWSWFWVFPHPDISVDPRSGAEQRHHILDQSVQRAFKRAAGARGSTGGAGRGIRRARHLRARMPMGTYAVALHMAA